MTKEITIVGGGLTGLSLAIALRKHGTRVILHEAGSYPRHRVCGEFISGVTPQTLENLGISEAFSDASHHRTVTWFSGNDTLRENTLPTPALGISRHLLDHRLEAIALSERTELKTSSRQKPIPNEPGLVWCAGRKPVTGKWIGLKAHIRGIGTTSDLEMHSGPRGYLGITPVEQGWKNACGLFRIDKSITARHQELLPAYLRKNGNTTLAAALESAEWRQDSFTAVAGFALGIQTPTPGLLSLGDSHSIIPPFTGNGMSMAFQSAEIALPHLLSYSQNKTTWQQTRTAIEHTLATHFRKRLTTAKFLHPFLFSQKARPLLKHLPLNPILKLVR